MTCIIFGASPTKDYGFDNETLTGDEFIIAADGGYDIAMSYGVKPNMVVGDFDSTSTTYYNIPVVTFPPEKDYTDSWLAVQEGFKAGCDNFVIYGALAGALEHTLANISLLAHILELGCTGVLRDGSSQVYLIDDNISLNSADGEYISLFPYGEQAEGVTITGAKYPLSDATLKNNFPLGVSNRFSGEVCVVSVTKGQLVVVVSNRKN